MTAMICIVNRSTAGEASMRSTIRFALLLSSIGCIGVACSSAPPQEAVGTSKQSLVTSWQYLSQYGFTFQYLGQTGRYSGTILDLEPTTSTYWRIATAGGGTWNLVPTFPIPVQTLSSDIGSLAHSTVATMPGNPNTFLIGTGEFNGASAGFSPTAGIWRSTNGGSSATQVLTASQTGGPVLRIRWGTSTTVHAATSNGYWRSTDSGATFAPVAFSGKRVYDVAINPSNPNSVFATVHGDGLYHSGNGGATWGSPIAVPGVTAGTYGWTTVAIAPSLPGTMYLQVAPNSGADQLLGIFKSTTQGASWSAVATPASSQVNYNNAIAVSPSDPNRVLSGTESLFLTTTGGGSWTNITQQAVNTPQLHGDVHAISWRDGNNVAVGTDGGLSLSSDAGAHWDAVDYNTLPTTLEWSIDVEPFGSDYRVAAAAWDVGFHTTASVSSPNWYGSNTTDGLNVNIDPGNSNRMWFLTGVPWARVRSDDGGLTWQSKNNGLPQVDWYSVVRDDHVPPVFLYANSASAVYTSTDFGDSWTKFPNSTANLPSTVMGLAVSPYTESLNGSTLWAALATTANRLEVYDPGQGAWFRRDGFTPADAIVVRPVAHSANPQKGYVVLDKSPKVWQTSDLGQTWTNITGDLPSSEVVNDFAVLPTDDSVMFVASNTGVWRTGDSGAHWVRWRNGFAFNSPAKSLKCLHDSTSGANWLFAGFWGRGVWRRDGNGTD